MNDDDLGLLVEDAIERIFRVAPLDGLRGFARDRAREDIRRELVDAALPYVDGWPDA